MFPAYFDPIRVLLRAALQQFLEEKSRELALVNERGSDAAARLLDFSLRGKMMRGCLVHLGWALGGGGLSAREAVTVVGAAMELFQSGLLVHDDIMDQDEVRRGSPSIYRQYTDLASREKSSDPPRVGKALGICAGDVAYFMAFELLARAAAPAEVRCQVLGLCARELSAVGIAQMQDVAWGATPSAVEVPQIVRMYTHKTGRYSFSLPLLTGALLAGAPPVLRERLEACGESLGLLFQIRDDELGLFGEAEEIGKPVGSDVREGKKTILFSVLLETASAEERRRLADILGNARLTEADLQFVRTLASSRAVAARMRQITDRLVEEADRCIRAITSGAEEDRAALRGLLDFSVGREQ